MVEEARSGPRFRVRGSQRPRLPGARDKCRNSAGSRGPEIVLGFGKDEPRGAPGQRAAAESGKFTWATALGVQMSPLSGLGRPFSFWLQFWALKPGRKGYLGSGWARSHRQLYRQDPAEAVRFGPAGPPVSPEPRGTGDLAPAPRRTPVGGTCPRRLEPDVPALTCALCFPHPGRV